MLLLRILSILFFAIAIVLDIIHVKNNLQTLKDFNPFKIKSIVSYMQEGISLPSTIYFIVYFVGVLNPLLGLVEDSISLMILIGILSSVLFYFIRILILYLIVKVISKA
ncbi:MAG: hypothetical protein PHZ24_02810 [Bacteroidales bacterium]|nr:hypothetical protein [Bacteroidales bacterium]